MTDIRELPDDIRVPLHSLSADAPTLFGRVAANGAEAEMMATAVRHRCLLIEEACLRTDATSKARIERLEAALENIANSKTMVVTVADARAVARAALKGERK